MKIYTKGGDKGETSLFGGKRLPKFHKRIAAYGTLDELNSHVGMLRDLTPEQYQDNLLKIQNELFVLGSHIASDPSKNNLSLPSFEEGSEDWLETWIDELDLELPPLKNFILPGGHITVSQCHIVRCVCRRAERLLTELAVEEGGIEFHFIAYLNRLSDVFFVVGRHVAQKLEAKEIPWLPNK